MRWWQAEAVPIPAQRVALSVQTCFLLAPSSPWLNTSRSPWRTTTADGDLTLGDELSSSADVSLKLFHLLVLL